MIILDSVTKKFGAFAAVDNVSYTVWVKTGIIIFYSFNNDVNVGLF